MKKEITRILRSLELSEYESKVYVALLELGEARSGKILTKAKINSGKIYTILESLTQKGLVSEIIKNNVRHFSAVDPRSLGKYLENKKKEFEEREKTFEAVLPHLLNLFSTSEQMPNIKIYMGYEGMKSAFDQEIVRYKKGKELRIFGVIDYNKHDSALVTYFTNTIFRERINKKIIIKKILSKDAKHNEIEKGAKVKFIDYNSFFTYNLIDDFTILSLWSKQPIFITIHSKEVSEGLRKNFDYIWKSARQ